MLCFVFGHTVVPALLHVCFLRLLFLFLIFHYYIQTYATHGPFLSFSYTEEGYCLLLLSFCYYTMPHMV